MTIEGTAVGIVADRTHDRERIAVLLHIVGVGVELLLERSLSTVALVAAIAPTGVAEAEAGAVR